MTKAPPRSVFVEGISRLGMSAMNNMDNCVSCCCKGIVGRFLYACMAGSGLSCLAV
jgi:hypothetical protein